MVPGSGRIGGVGGFFTNPLDPLKVMKTQVFSSFFTLWSSQEGLWSEGMPQGAIWGALWRLLGSPWAPFGGLWVSVGLALRSIWLPFGLLGSLGEAQECPRVPRSAQEMPRRWPCPEGAQECPGVSRPLCWNLCHIHLLPSSWSRPREARSKTT